MEDAYAVVKSYLKSNQGADVSDIIRDTGVSLSTINSIMSDGRMQIR